jgi:HSP20 family protein
MFPVLRYNLALAPVESGRISRLDSLFDRVIGNDLDFTKQAWDWPRVSMWEDDDYVHIEAELPGVSDQDVDVTVHNGMLFIRGERKPEEGRRYLYNGRSFGQFEQTIPITVAVETDDVKATLTNGILSIDLPKSSEAKPRKIVLDMERSGR